MSQWDLPVRTRYSGATVGFACPDPLQWCHSGVTVGNAAPGPVPRCTTKVRTMSHYPLTPGTTTPPTGAPAVADPTLSAVGPVRQASFGYNRGVKEPFLVKSRKWRKSVFFGKIPKMTKISVFIENYRFIRPGITALPRDSEQKVQNVLRIATFRQKCYILPKCQ